MATWASIGAAGMFLIIASSGILKNEAPQEEVIQEGERGVELVMNNGLAWPNKNRITITGEDAVYAVEGQVVSRNGVVGDYGEQGERARRVAYFATWMEMDPLFASRFIDLEQTKKTIRGLRETQERSKRELGITNDVYGVEFLDAFIESSIALRAFEKEYSERNAVALLDAMRRTNDAYAKNIRDLKNTIEPLREQKQKLVFLDGQAVSDYGRISDDLGIMLRNAEAVRSQISERERCLKESEDACAFVLPQTAEPEPIQETTTQPKVLSAEELHMRKGVAYDGPYQIEGQCWKSDPKPFVYVGTECPKSLPYCFQKAFLAERTFYVEIGNNEPYKKFYDRGIRAIPQSATTPYDCTDLEYQMQLATLHGAAKAYAGQGIFERLGRMEGLTDEERNLLAKGTVAEKGFIESKYPSAAELRHLEQWYGFAYVQLVMRGHAKKEPINELLARYQKQREQLTDFYLLVNKARFHFENYMTEFAEGGNRERKIVPAYIYAIRSHYALLYMNASPVVWRVAERPKYILQIKEKPKRPEEGGIRDSEYVFEKYGKATVLQWQRMYDQIMPFAHDDR